MVKHKLKHLVAKHLKPKEQTPGLRTEQDRDDWRSRSLRRQRSTRVDDRDEPRQNLNRGEAPLGEIDTIAGGFVEGRTSASSRKAHARRARYKEVYTTDRSPKQPR